MNFPPVIISGRIEWDKYRKIEKNWPKSVSKLVKSNAWLRQTGAHKSYERTKLTNAYTICYSCTGICTKLEAIHNICKSKSQCTSFVVYMCARLHSPLCFFIRYIFCVSRCASYFLIPHLFPLLPHMFICGVSHASARGRLNRTLSTRKS